VTSWHALLAVVRGRENFNQGQPVFPCGSLINIAVGGHTLRTHCQFSSGVHFGTALSVEMFNLLQFVFFGMLHVPESALVLG
jgi:hypothetical protein